MKTENKGKFKVLKAEDICKNYGGVYAVKDIDIYLNKGEIVGLIGSNGAGKTTLFNILTGYEKQTNGDIFINQKSIKFETPVDFVEKSIIRTFQNVRIFNNLTVLDNLLTAKIAQSSFTQLIKKKSSAKEIDELLKISKLESYKFTIGQNLPFGVMKMIEVIRCILSGCKVLFLDEPGAGMSKDERNALGEMLLILKEQYDLTYMIIEHDMDFISLLCSRVYMMHCGEILCHGKVSDVLSNKTVIYYLTGRKV